MLKKCFIAMLFYGLGTIGACCQIIAVSAVIQDTDSIVWVGGTWSVQLVSSGGAPTYLGVPVPTNIQSGSINAINGRINVNLNNTATISPYGAQYYWTICPKASAPCSSFYTPVLQSNLSALLSSNLTTPRFPAGPTAYGYNDIEVFPIPPPGGIYYNVSTSTQRIWNGAAWANNTSGSGTVATCSTTPGNYFLISDGAGNAICSNVYQGAGAGNNNITLSGNVTAGGLYLNSLAVGCLGVNSSFQIYSTGYPCPSTYASTPNHYLSQTNTTGGYGDSGITQPTLPPAGAAQYLLLNSSGVETTTLGISPYCAGIVGSCGLQQYNYAPCGTDTSLGATLNPTDMTVTVASTACLSPSGGVIVVENNSPGEFIAYSGYTGNVLTVTARHFWGTVAGGSVVTGGSVVSQVTYAIAATTTSYPSVFSLQDNTYVYSYDGSFAIPLNGIANLFKKPVMPAGFYAGNSSLIEYNTGSLYPGQLTIYNQNSSCNQGDMSIGSISYGGITYHIGGSSSNCVASGATPGPNLFYINPSIFPAGPTTAPPFTMDQNGNVNITGTTKTTYVASGPTFTSSGCSATSLVGVSSTGKFVSGVSGTCTITVTTGLTAPNGYVCSVNDLTTPADIVRQTASSTTTATLSGTTVSGDTINFNCTPY